MVKFNRILTLLGVSALCSFVAGYPSEYEDGYDGECKEFNDFIVEHKGNINYCEMESGQIIEIGLNVETLNQAIVDKLGTHPIDIVSFQKIGKIEKNLSLESISAVILSLRNDSKKGSTIPKNVLKTVNNAQRLTISNYKITQSNINDIGASNYLSELTLTVCTYEKNLDFSKLKNNSSLKKLTLYSDDNNYIGKFPESLCKDTVLTRLDIYQGKIKSIPKCIGKLQNLESLQIYNNTLTDLPEEISKLTNLRSLTLDYNEFTSVPSVIGKLKNLNILSLSYNEITKIPSAITKLANLEILDLDNNKIKSIPDSIGKLKNLNYLIMNNNKIKLIPDSIGKLKNLGRLVLNNNSITNLPNALGKLENLHTIELNNNKIDAVIPESLNNIRYLYGFEADGNVDIRGKTLTNPELMDCYYNEESNKTKDGLCVAKGTVCKPRFDVPDCE